MSTRDLSGESELHRPAKAKADGAPNKAKRGAAADPPDVTPAVAALSAPPSRSFEPAPMPVASLLTPEEQRAAEAAFDNLMNRSRKGKQK